MQRVVSIVRMMIFPILLQNEVTVSWTCCQIWHI